MGGLWVRVPRLPLRARSRVYQNAGLVSDHPQSGDRWLQIVLAEQHGVLATLSRWRSWVQIPSRTSLRDLRSEI